MTSDTSLPNDPHLARYRIASCRISHRRSRRRAFHSRRKSNDLRNLTKYDRWFRTCSPRLSFFEYLPKNLRCRNVNTKNDENSRLPTGKRVYSLREYKFFCCCHSPCAILTAGILILMVAFAIFDSCRVALSSWRTSLCSERVQDGKWLLLLLLFLLPGPRFGCRPPIFRITAVETRWGRRKRRAHVGGKTTGQRRARSRSRSRSRSRPSSSRFRPPPSHLRRVFSPSASESIRFPGVSKHHEASFSLSRTRTVSRSPLYRRFRVFSSLWMSWSNTSRAPGHLFVN